MRAASAVHFRQRAHPISPGMRRRRVVADSKLAQVATRMRKEEGKAGDEDKVEGDGEEGGLEPGGREDRGASPSTRARVGTRMLKRKAAPVKQISRFGQRDQGDAGHADDQLSSLEQNAGSSGGGGAAAGGRARAGSVEGESVAESGDDGVDVADGFQGLGSSVDPSDLARVPGGAGLDVLGGAQSAEELGGGRNPLTELERLIEEDAAEGERKEEGRDEGRGGLRERGRAGGGAGGREGGREGVGEGWREGGREGRAGQGRAGGGKRQR